MKKLIITCFVLIFIIFGLSSGITIFHLHSTTSNLRHLINFHKIEDIRQTLSSSFQKIQGYAFSSPTDFADHLDEINDNAELVNKAVQQCHNCHHIPEIEAELDDVTSQIGDYQAQLSLLITTVASGEQRREHQQAILDQSNVIFNHVQEMVSRVAQTLKSKTDQAMREIDASYKFLIVTILLTLFAALIVVQYLARRITKPIEELHTAAMEIARGKLGYQADSGGSKEFTQLIDTFNSMSALLAQKENTIQASLEKLHQLYLITRHLHESQDLNSILTSLASNINRLIDVEHFGILVPNEKNDHFILHHIDIGDKSTEKEPIILSTLEISETFHITDGKPLLQNEPQDKTKATLPFTEKLPEIKAEKILLSWMLNKDKINGALVTINKKEGDFSEEDARILGILANNMDVALENIRLLKETQFHIQELKKTQHQLIEAEKLTALGTLAGGVAHDFNNILCGMIGYVSMLKRDQDPEGKDFKMLDAIEKAGFRAANLTKQLLTFSRQEIMDLRPIDVNPHIENVAKLLQKTLNKIITIKLELNESLPQILSDPAQLELIIMNLCVNARDAMQSGGQILIQSEKVMVDRKFCEAHLEARPGAYIKISVSDQGQGIDPEVLPRIFDPFFTTKDFGQGAGLGLAMVYGIVKSQKGFITVSSVPGQETTFSLYLPEAAPTEREDELSTEISDLKLQASILIVDDEELVSHMLVEHLENLGCRTFQAGNGEDALVILKKHKDKIDLVILDLNLPVMDGKTVFEKILEIKPDLKILVASGYSLNGTAREILAKGAAGFIQKPYSLESLTTKIRVVLDDTTRI
jgi:signal transduction histidine kinase/ActR/RegA family two-component response regulator/HAMP domain-containing protein